MNKEQKRLALWKEAIPRMNEEDLEFILDFSECFEPKMVKMVEAQYKKMSNPVDDEEDDSNDDNIICSVFSVLNEMECPAKFDRDGDIQFTFQDEDFFITAGDDGPFIDIWEYNWMQVSLNEVYKVSMLRQAINDINSIGDIATTYSVNKECHEFHVHCCAKILFFSYTPNRRGYLEYVLRRFFDTHRLLEEQFLKITREEIPPEEVVN